MKSEWTQSPLKPLVLHDLYQRVAIRRSAGGGLKHRRSYDACKYFSNVNFSVSIVEYLLIYLFRWLIGIILSVVIAGVNQFFSMRCT